jgi:hypothetical protein
MRGLGSGYDEPYQRDQSLANGALPKARRWLAPVADARLQQLDVPSAAVALEL